MRPSPADAGPPLRLTWRHAHPAAVAVRRALVYTHRWLGIVGSILILAWLVSGVMMMYARMPRLSAEERLMRAAPLDLATARVAPAAAAALAPARVQRLRIGMLGDRPVYRLHDGTAWVTMFADSGEALSQLHDAEALELARRFAPEHGATARTARRLVEPDQWTLQVRGLLPAHEVTLGDPAGTRVYISERTGEPVLRTTRRTRLLGYGSAVLHWIYFTPIRRHSDVWVQLIIWTSIAGTLLCVSGLFWGIWRFSRTGRYRLRGVPHAHSPYAGLMKWHHYAGLVFGATTCTWVFSGLLSMNPWDWSPSTAPTISQRDAFSGGPLRLDRLSLDRLRASVATLAEAFPVHEIEVLQFRGEMVAAAYRTPDPGTALRLAFADPGAVVAARVPMDHRLVRIDAPERGLFASFDRRAVEAAARDAMPGAPVEDVQWLTTHDAYYYGRCDDDPCREPPLPVLRVKFADPGATWLYVDPARGVIARREGRRTRLNRWLYRGLHSLDLPGLYNRRPLWDLVVIALSLGGIVVTLSSAVVGWRRLRRHARRIRATMRDG